jgi:hypothetical protein
VAQRPRDQVMSTGRGQTPPISKCTPKTKGIQVLYVVDSLHMGRTPLHCTLIFFYISIHTQISRYEIYGPQISHHLLLLSNTDLSIRVLTYLQIPFPPQAPRIHPIITIFHSYRSNRSSPTTINHFWTTSSTPYQLIILYHSEK